MDERLADHYETFLPFHLAWRHDACVAYRVSDLVDGRVTMRAVFDELAHLNATGAVTRMQAAISQQAHHLIFGVEGHFHDDDAVGVLLRGLLKMTRQEQ